MSFAEELKKPREHRRLHDMVQMPEKDKPAVYFDVEKEVGEEERKGMEKQMREFLSVRDHLGFAMGMLDDFAFLRPGVTDRRKEIKKILKYYHSSRNPDNMLWAGAFLLARLYGREDLLPKDIYETMWEKEKCCVDRHTPDFGYKSAEEMFILDAERAKNEYVVDASLMDTMRRKAEEVRDEEKWFQYAILLRNFKFISPETLSIFDIHGAWPNFENELEERRNEEDWLGFTELAAAMKIIAAKEVVVTDHGVEFIMPGQGVHKEKIPPRPRRLDIAR